MPCKDCHAAGIETSRPTPHPGPRCATHHRAVQKARRATNGARRRQSLYGITEDEYRAIIKYQGGHCAICQRANGRTKALSVDHDHQTGLVRGICCSYCNLVIGRLGREALLRAAAYLDKPPAVRAIGCKYVPSQGARER